MLVPMALLAVYGIWGSTYLGIRLALESYPPLLMAGLRFLSAGVVLMLAMVLRGTPMPSLRQWRNACFTGLLLLGLGNGLVCVAEQRVNSGIAAVAVACEPFMVALFVGMYGQWPTRRETAGLAIGFAGVIGLNLGGSLSGSPIGALWLLLASLGFAFGSAWSRTQDMPRGAMNTAIQMLFAGMVLVLAAWTTGERLPVNPKTGAILALIYLVAFGSLIAYSAYLYLLRHVRPALASSYAYVNPPVAVLLGALLAGERVRPMDVLGMVVIMTGVVIITLPVRRQV